MVSVLLRWKVEDQWMTESRPTLLGITGTDTGVGKTIVACALAARAGLQGHDL